MQSTAARLPFLAFAAVVPLGFGNEGDDELLGKRENAALQLSALLDSARIDSPLIGLQPAEDLNSLKDPELDVLVEEGFEEFEWQLEGWPDSSVAEVVTSPDGKGRMLRLDGVTDAPLGWILPVEPDAFYQFTRSVQFQGEPFCDMYVVESRLEMDETRPDPRTYFLAGRGEALKIHTVPLDRDYPDGEWQRASASFYPTPRTRSLAVVIRPRTGADTRATVLEMAFDDVLLEQVFPSRKERIQLLKAAHPARNADPARGLRKSGWLLPLPSPEGVREGEAAESNYNWREALYAPPKTEIAFDLTLPAGAHLRLASGLARETPPGAAARFQIEFTPKDGETEQVLDLVRTAKMEEWSWNEADIDLSPWAGKAGTLVLRTLSEKGDPHPLWANPRIQPGASASDPMVILIAVDTLRADRLSAYGYERETTPALDRLAAEGVRFDQARSNCNWTCPSFASIFTGLVPSRHGVSSYGPATPLPDELITLAEHFQFRGWTTRSIAYKVPLFDGNYEQGFDQAFNVPRDFIRGEENLARALEWLESHRGGPSFLFLHFNDPHQPFIQPEPFDRQFGPAPETVGLSMPPGVPSGSQEDSVEMFSALYDGAVSYVDSCIGGFLDALRDRGLYENASIAFVADHGEQLWEHGRFGHGGNHLYDEIVRVPLIVKPPANTFEAGKVITAEVSGFDVMPTLLELAGIAPMGRLDARSLIPLISGARKSLNRVVVTETSQRGFALVNGGYKFVLQPGGVEEALFHLPSDPMELTNLVGERPEEMARLRSLAIAYLLEHRPGNFLLVHAGDKPAMVRVSTQSMRTLVGPQLSFETSGDVDQSSAQLEANAWALFQVEGAAAYEARVLGLKMRGKPLGFGPWVAGRLPSLKGPGVWRVHGPEASSVIEASVNDMDPEMLEALRRLGYTE